MSKKTNIKTPEQILHRVQRIIEAAIQRTERLDPERWPEEKPTDRAARSVLESINVVKGYAEPGYGGLDPDNAIIALGNWNEITRWDRDTQRSITISKIPCKVAKLIEKSGADIEWEDEWTTCDECMKLVRTNADCYSWKRSYVENDDGGTLCFDCQLEDVEGYLESLEGNPDTCATLEVDPTDHGYVLVLDRLEHGFHRGMDADPKVIAKTLERHGIERFLFKLDESSQFYSTFSMYVHEDEKGKLPAGWNQDEIDGPSVSDGLDRALRAVGEQSDKLRQEQAEKGGVIVSDCDVSTGEAKTRLVSPEEFVRGIGKEESK